MHTYSNLQNYTLLPWTWKHHVPLKHHHSTQPQGVRAEEQNEHNWNCIFLQTFVEQNQKIYINHHKTGFALLLQNMCCPIDGALHFFITVTSTQNSNMSTSHVVPEDL
jgi:hypothetical protein